jgi:hypothetical protein
VVLLGRVAQLGERGVRNAEVEGSNPFASTKNRLAPTNPDQSRSFQTAVLAFGLEFQ